MKTTKTILTKIVHILIVIFTGKTPAFFTETVAEGTTVSGEIVAPQEWDGLNRNHQIVFGTVTDTILRGDSQNYSPPNWAQQDVFSGGYTNNITVENTGNQSIFGGTAENTVIKDKGIATLKNQGIFKDGKVYKGGFFSAQSGTVDNINVYENGRFDISGNDDGVIVEGGEITHGATGVFMGKARINNLKISGDVAAASLKGDVTVGERGQLNVINNGELDTREANLNLSGRVNLDNDPDPGKVSKFGKVSMNQGHFYFDYSISGGFSKNYSILFLETLSGTGTFWMNTDIAEHRGDFLLVRGEANGYFGVRVTDSGKSPKAEDSLKIIQTGGGDADFDLTNPGQVVDVGTYQYHLVPDNHKRGWSLVSHQPQPSEKPQPESESPPKASVIPSATETVAASRPISGDTLLPKETEHSVQPGIGSKATELKPAVPVMSSVPEEKETVLTPVSGETVAPAVTDETQTRKLAAKAPEPKPEVPVAPSVPEEKETVLTPVSGETVAPAVTDETQTRKLAAKAPEPKPEVPVAPSVPEEKETVLTPVSGETVAPAVIDETQTRKLVPKAPEPKPEAPVPPSAPKEKGAVLTPVSGETETKKVPPNRLLSPPKNVSRTNRAPDIPSITPSTAAVLSMSTVGPLIYHSEMAQIQERMSETRQAKTEDTVWVKVMNQRQNISQKAGDGYWLRLNGLSVGADCTIRLGRAYTTRGVFFTHSDDKLNFRGKAIGGGNVSSWSAGTYAAYYHDSGFWLDGILKANRFSQEIRGKMTGGGDAFGDFSTLALGASIRGGKDMVAGEMTFTPYLSLSGLRTTRSSLSLSNGMKGDIFAQRSVLGKVGLRALYQTRIKEVSVTPWVDVGAEREFIKNNRVRINQRDSFDNDLSGITGVYSLGLSANISQTWNISATAGYKQGKHIESPWSTSLGMSWKF